MWSSQSCSQSHRKLWSLDGPSELSHLEARGLSLYTPAKGMRPWAIQLSSVRTILGMRQL